LQRDRKEQDEDPANGARNQEHGELIAGKQLNHKRAAHRRNGQTDTHEPRDPAALNARNLIWQHRNQGSEQRIEK
jgi:hypothetical protein